MANRPRFGGLSKRDPHIIEGQQGQTVENSHIMDGILQPFEDQGAGYFSENDNTVIATIDVGERPTYVAITVANARVYVANGIDDSVSAIHLGTNAVVATISMQGGAEFPDFILVLPDETLSYVSSRQGSQEINVIHNPSDAISGVVTDSVWGIHMVATSDSAYVYSSTWDFRIQKIDTSTDTIVETIVAGEQVTQLAITSDDAYVYVANGLKDFWRKIGGDGDYSSWDTNYEIVNAMASNGTNLYAGLGNSTGDAEVHEYNGNVWSKIGGDGVNSSWSGYATVQAMAFLNDKLYVTVAGGATGAEVWEYTISTTTWAQIGGAGVNSSWDDSYSSAPSLVSHSGKLYAGTGTDADQIEVWEYTPGTTTWAIVGGNGENSSWATPGNAGTVQALVSHDSVLYAGLSGSAGDAELWAYSGGSWAVISDSTINPDWAATVGVKSMVVHNSKIYAGLWGLPGDADLWEYVITSTSWSQVGGDDINSSWAASTYEGVYSLVSYNGSLYAGLGQSTTDAEIWELTGSSWTKIGGDGVTGSWNTNYETIESMTVHLNALYSGLGRSTTDAEVWRYMNDYSVSVIKTSDDSLYANILGLDETPWWLAITPDDKKVYVSNTDGNTVSAIDVATNTLLVNIPVGTTPRHIAISNDSSTAYVCNYDSATVSIIDTATDRVIKNLGVADNPFFVTISPNSKYAYVSHFGGDSISSIEVSTNTLISTTTVGSAPYVIAITPDNKRAYVCDTGDDTVSVIETFPWDSRDLDGADLFLVESTSMFDLYVISDTKLYLNNFETECLDADDDSLDLHTTRPNSFLDAFGKYYIGDATQAYVRKSATVFRRMGLPKPDSSLCTTVENGAGNITDTEMAYAVTFVDSATGRESILSDPIVDVTSTTSKKITVGLVWASADDPDNIDPEINKINIYRKGFALGGVYLFVAQVDHDASTYDDDDATPTGGPQDVEFDDISKDSGNYEYPQSNDPNFSGPRWSQFVEFGSRIFASKPDSHLLYYSAPYPDVEYWPPLNFLVLPGNIVKLVPISDSELIIFTMKGIHRLLGETPDVWDLSALSSEVPTDTAGYIVDAGIGIFVLVTDGIKVLAGDHLEYVFESELRPLFRENFGLGNWGSVVNMSLFAYKGSLLVFWEDSSVAKLLVIDVNNQIFYQRTLKATPMAGNGWFTNLQQESGLFTTTEMIHFSYLSESPVGGRHAALPFRPAFNIPAGMTYRTKNLDLGNREFAKNVGTVNITASGSFTLQVYVDKEDEDGATEKTLFDEPKTFSSNNLQFYKVGIKPNTSNHISLEFKNTSNELCKIFDYSISGFPNGDKLAIKA